MWRLNGCKRWLFGRGAFLGGGGRLGRGEGWEEVSDVVLGNVAADDETLEAGGAGRAH